MKNKLALLAVMASVALPVVANAETPGFYVSGAAGANWLEDAKFKNAALNQKTTYDASWAGAGALGYAYSTGFRSELELAYLNNDINNIAGVTTPGGSAESWVLTVNALYDFMRESRFNPYVGIGIGGASVDYSVQTIGGANLSDDDLSLAIKGIAGASYKLTDALSLFANYEYTNIASLNYTNAVGTDVEVDNQNHTVLAGVRFSFGKPAPVAAPAPAPAPAPTPAPVAVQEGEKSRSYIIFFDFDKTVITPEARKILEQVAADAKAGNTTRVELTGHADRSGTDKYNLKLSERRAAAAKKELLKLGLPESEIATSAKGESMPLVPTQDGVREPQNRRVEIVYVVKAK